MGEIEILKKVLVVTTVASTLDQFCMSDICILQKYFKVHVAANFSVGNNTSDTRVSAFKAELMQKGIVVNEINFNRNPFCKSNFVAYKEIRKVIEENSFDIIHCHTPVAAAIVRLAARKYRSENTKVIYTAHGFHFFKGAPIRNWLIFYPVEKFLAQYTDVLITINKEDYERAQKSLRAECLEYIPGVGIDTDFFSKTDFDKKKNKTRIGIA